MGSRIWEFRGLIRTTVRRKNCDSKEEDVFCNLLKWLLKAEYWKKSSHQLEVYFHSKVTKVFPCVFSSYFILFSEKEEDWGFVNFKQMRPGDLQKSILTMNNNEIITSNLKNKNKKKSFNIFLFLVYRKMWLKATLIDTA